MKLSIVTFCLLVVLLISLRFHLNASAPMSSTILDIHMTQGTPVSVDSPQRRDLNQVIHPTGNIKETKAINAGFEISGRLKSLPCNVGQYVHEGDILAELDKSAQEATVEANRAALAQAEANLLKAVNGPRKLDIEVVEAALKGAEATLRFTKSELERVKGLVNKEAAPQRQLDEANTAYLNAVSAHIVTKTKIALLTAGTREEDILAAKAQVHIARAHLKASTIALENHVLVAPFSGIISSVPVERGDVIKSVPTAQTIAQVLQVTPILFESTVSELFIPYITKTTIATITVDAFPGESHEGRFYELVPKGNLRDRTFTVRFSIENKDKKLKPGMFGRSSIALSHHENVLTIPVSVLRDPDSIESFTGDEVVFSSSLNTKETQKMIDSSRKETNDSNAMSSVKAVMISENGISAARLVNTGYISGNLVEIKSGLTEDDLIVTEGFAELKTGVKLKFKKGTENSPKKGTENSPKVESKRGLN